MKKKDFNKKLELKKSLIANLNYLQMRNIIGASENLNDNAPRATDGTGDGLLNPTTLPPTHTCATNSNHQVGSQ